MNAMLVCFNCDSVDCSPPDSSVHGIFEARILEWVAFPSPGDLPDSGIESRSPESQADSLPSEPPGKPIIYIYVFYMGVCMCDCIIKSTSLTFCQCTIQWC